MNKQEEDEIFGKLVLVASAALPEMFSARNYCLNGTRVLIDVLQHFGIEAKPLSVQLVVTNAAWKECLDKVGVATQAMVDEWVESKGAWSVGIDTSSPKEPGLWNGHIVLVTDRVLVDSAIGQLSRPEKNMKLPGAFACEYAPEFFSKGRALSIVGPKGVWVRYWAREKDKSFEQLPGFQRSQTNQEVTEEIIELMSKL